MDFEVEMARLYQQSYTTTGKLTTLKLIENSPIPYIENAASKTSSISRSTNTKILKTVFRPITTNAQKPNSKNETARILKATNKLNTIENNASKINLISRSTNTKRLNTVSRTITTNAQKINLINETA